MIAMLIYLLILLLFFGVIAYCVRFMPLAEPFRSAVYVILLLVFLIVLLSFIGVIPGGPWPRMVA
jgi:hypothetical protein